MENFIYQLNPFKRNIISIITNTGSYMSAHVLLNLLNKLRKKDKLQGSAEQFVAFSQQV